MSGSSTGGRSSDVAGKSILNRVHHTMGSSNPALLVEDRAKFLASFLFTMLSTTLPREAAGIKQQYDPDSIGVIVSSKATNEDGFNAEVRTHRHLLQRLLAIIGPSHSVRRFCQHFTSSSRWLVGNGKLGRHSVSHHFHFGDGLRLEICSPEELAIWGRLVSEPTPSGTAPQIKFNRLFSADCRTSSGRPFGTISRGFWRLTGKNAATECTLCCHWRYSRRTIILPPGAIQSCHLIRSGLDYQSRCPRTSL
jgi:hypothetical protein